MTNGQMRYGTRDTVKGDNYFVLFCLPSSWWCSVHHRWDHEQSYWLLLFICIT